MQDGTMKRIGCALIACALATAAALATIAIYAPNPGGPWYQLGIAVGATSAACGTIIRCTTWLASRVRDDAWAKLAQKYRDATPSRPAATLHTINGHRTGRTSA